MKIKEFSEKLIVAVEDNNLDAIKDCIANGADLNYVNDDNDTALNKATFWGRLDIAKFLIEKGADVNKGDKFNVTPLMVAAHREELDIAKFFIEKGANVNAKNGDNYTALHYTTYPSSDGMKTSNSYDLNQKYDLNLKIAKLLIEHGADVNAQDDNQGWTPIIQASAYGHLDIVKLLVEKGANVNDKNKENATALDRANEQGRTEIAEFLIQNGGKTGEELGNQSNVKKRK